MLQQGLGPSEIARTLGVDRRSVRRWRAAMEKEGAQGLAAHPASGRPALLSEAQKNKLERALRRGAQAVGYETDLWTCPRIAQVIASRLGVHYHVDHVCRLLHKLGWSPQRPQRKAMERDEEGIRQWVKQGWTGIKKKPAA
jgi:transposase